MNHDNGESRHHTGTRWSRHAQSPKCCGFYSPGHETHFINAKAIWSDSDPGVVPADLLDIDGDKILFKAEDATVVAHYHNTARLAVVANGRAVSFSEKWNHLFVVHRSGRYYFNIALSRHEYISCDQDSGSEPARDGAYLEFPEDWDDLTPEQRHEAALGMAVELRRGLGIAPDGRETG